MKTAKQGTRYKPGELSAALVNELLKHPPGQWVPGSVLAADLNTGSSFGAVVAAKRGIVEGRMGTGGGYRLTDRGRRLAKAGLVDHDPR